MEIEENHCRYYPKSRDKVLEGIYEQILNKSAINQVLDGFGNPEKSLKTLLKLPENEENKNKINQVF